MIGEATWNFLNLTQCQDLNPLFSDHKDYALANCTMATESNRSERFRKAFHPKNGTTINTFRDVWSRVLSMPEDDPLSERASSYTQIQTSHVFNWDLNPHQLGESPEH